MATQVPPYNTDGDGQWRSGVTARRSRATSVPVHGRSVRVSVSDGWRQISVAVVLYAAMGD